MLAQIWIILGRGAVLVVLLVLGIPMGIHELYRRRRRRGQKESGWE